MFEKGLPGYDDWLDNHGNPGMGDDMYDGGIWYWAITEETDVTQIAENKYRIQRVNGPEWFDLSFDTNAEVGRSVLINDKFYDLGEDTISYISIIDDYHEQGAGGIGITVRSEPFGEE